MGNHLNYACFDRFFPPETGKIYRQNNKLAQSYSCTWE